jgi:two-component system NtrC family sensor kinase
MAAAQEAVPFDEAPPRRRILVVEDDPGIRRSMQDTLEDEGFDVVTSNDGKAALETLRSSVIAPDVVLLDLMMPVMDGWEFRTEQLRDPTLKEIPVIAISADGSPRATAIHADAYLPKPVRTSELLSVMNRVLEEHATRRRRERLEHTQRMAALGMLAAGVGHDINNSLTGVLGNLNLAARGLPGMQGDLAAVRASGLSPPGAQACSSLEGRMVTTQALLAEAHAGADRVRVIAGNLRRFVTPPDRQRKTLDLRDVVARSVQLAMSHFRGCGRLVTELQESVPIVGDEGQLTQVFVNLLINAAQAVRSEDRQRNVIRVGVKRAGDRALADVEDNGLGIPPEIRARLFEPFFTTKPPGEGSGLGLAICRGIVDLHGGAIEVESEPGRGALFRVSLAIAAATETATIG